MNISALATAYRQQQQAKPTWLLELVSFTYHRATITSLCHEQPTDGSRFIGTPTHVKQSRDHPCSGYQGMHVASQHFYAAQPQYVNEAGHSTYSWFMSQKDSNVDAQLQEQPTATAAIAEPISRQLALNAWSGSTSTSAVEHPPSSGTSGNPLHGGASPDEHPGGDILNRYNNYKRQLQAVFPSQVFDDNTMLKQFQEQLKQELRAAHDEQQRFTHSVKSMLASGVGEQLSSIQHVKSSWTAQLTQALEAHLQQLRTFMQGKLQTPSAAAAAAAAGSTGTRSSSSSSSSSAGLQAATSGMQQVMPSPLLWLISTGLGPEQVALITVTVIMRHVMLRLGRSVGDVKPTYARVVREIGYAIRDSTRFTDIRKQLNLPLALSGSKLERVKKVLSLLDTAAKVGLLPPRQHGLALSHIKKLGAVLTNPQADSTSQEAWDDMLITQIGSQLLRLAIDHGHLPDGSPIVQCEEQEQEQGGHDYVGRTVLPSQQFAELLLRNNGIDAKHFLDSRSLPMRVPPVPWSRLFRGGQLLAHHPAVRGYNTTDREWLVKADMEGSMTTLFKGLTLLGQVPWRVNSSVLRTAQQLQGMDQETKQSLAVPIAQCEPLPMSPTAWVTSIDSNTGQVIHQDHDQGYTPYLRMSREGKYGGMMVVTAGPLTRTEKMRLQRVRRSIRQDNCNRVCEAHEYNLKISTAATLSAWQCFWQPHSVDFRGRAYPISGYLTHHGDDLSRGLLEFAEGRPLGPQGLSWLCIQLANCTGRGHDKLPMKEREKYGRSRIPDCLATLQNPWGSQGSWWQDGEKPWQLLATALEIGRAVRTGRPEAYISHLPVHQDGSCNGLQHYAALARDTKGAVAVNLVPADRPQDVYSEVAAAVEVQVKQDAADGIHQAATLLARNDDRVDRKLVKQSVMTTVYGVTFIGARDQIAARLSERGWSDEREVFAISSYLAKVTLDSVARVFQAKSIMGWLANSATAVTRAGHRVTWTSPLGFPIKQPYMALDDEGKEKVDKRAQRTAFPPNYIHSLDAAHMMMTAVHCYDKGITFGAVHDSFFTHASTVDTMNQVLREQFVALHSQPLLHILKSQLEPLTLAAKSAASGRASGARKAVKIEDKDRIPDLPHKGDLDLSCVLHSPYFFS